MMDGISVLLALTALNNRSTEAFKLWLRDNSPISDELRRLLTLIFSVVFGMVSVAGAYFSGVSFEGTLIEPFEVNMFALIAIGGASVSIISGIVQPIIERLEPPTLIVEGLEVESEDVDEQKNITLKATDSYGNTKTTTIPA